MNVRHRVIILVALPILAAAGLAWSLIRPWEDVKHSSDAELIEFFRSHEHEFGQLVSMVRSDKGLDRVDDSWTSPGQPTSIGISHERIKEYRRLFKRLGIPRGFDASREPEMFIFYASSQGLGVSGTAKGYAYLAEPPEQIIAALDDCILGRTDSFTAYRHIKERWYLFFDYEN